jgi:hypothetical protein
MPVGAKRKSHAAGIPDTDIQNLATSISLLQRILKDLAVFHNQLEVFLRSFFVA